MRRDRRPWQHCQMSDSSEQGPERPETPRKRTTLDLDALTPEKVPVQTSLGTLYAGAHGFPQSALKDDQDEEVGRKVVKHTCSRVEHKNDTAPLSDEVVAALTDEDIAVLGPVVAKQQRWLADDRPNNFAAIGHAAKGAQERQSKLVQAEFKKMQDSLSSSFGFLNQATLQKLRDDMTGLSVLRKLTESPGASAILLKAAEDLRNHREGGVLDAIKKSSPDSLGAMASLSDSLTRRLDQPPPPPELRIDTPRVFHPEDSPLGRAALRNADNSEQTVELMRELTKHMAGVQETLVREVLPQWIAQVMREQDKANADSAQAARNTANAAASLRWAKWAIAASIVVTVAATWWQVQVAREIDSSNTKQLQRAEELLQEQLAAQRQAAEQRRAESQHLIEVVGKALEQRKQPATAAPPKKRSNAGG
jgi:hypothetical protein